METILWMIFVVLVAGIIIVTKLLWEIYISINAHGFISVKTNQLLNDILNEALEQ